MTGLIKAKQYDWKDSNLALFGSDTDKRVKKESSRQEPAWKNAGNAVGLKIWRIVKFKVTDWPENDYGKFFSGDSYIILNTYKTNPNGNELAYDVHFWIGSKSTQDEYGTAAYKTVELDTFLDDKPVQHREVQGHESDLFRSYFPRGIMILEGGAESGFRHVEQKTYRPRLLHFSGVKRKITVKEVPLSPSRLNSDDVFILDLGTTLYQWNGTGCNKDEKFQATQFLVNLRSERGKSSSETLEQETTPDDHPFYSALTGEDDGDDVDFGGDSSNFQPELYRVSDSTGNLKMTKVKEGRVAKTDLDTKDVFILDTGKNCFVWIGKGTSAAEKQNGFGYAHSHLMKTQHPLVPVIVIKEGQKNNDFNSALAA